MIVWLILVIFLCFASSIPENCCSPISKRISVVDDQRISDALVKVRSDFLKRRKYDELNAVLYVEDMKEKDKWYRGMVNGDKISYPASTVKLNYYVSSMQWCLENGMTFDCLDSHTRPMIVYSSNFETGVVVDTITSAPNIFNLTSYMDPRWNEWQEKRFYTQNLLKKFGYSKNQVILSKTYPSNSAWPLEGAEKLLIDKFGKNQMSPCCGSALMLDIMYEAEGLIPKDSLTHSKQTLFKQRNEMTCGLGLPPGCEIYSKGGLAYDTLEDIFFTTLPNHQRIQMAVYSNAFQRSWDSQALSGFVEMIIDELDLNHGGPEKIVLTPTSNPNNFIRYGDWKNESSAIDKLGDLYYSTNSKKSMMIIWLDIETEGLYELSFYNPTVENPSLETKMIIQHRFGNETVVFSQQRSSVYSIIDNFNFLKGRYQIQVFGSEDGRNVIVNALKVIRWPECNGVPGTFCSMQKNL